MKEVFIITRRMLHRKWLLPNLLYPARCPVCDRVTAGVEAAPCPICRSLGKPECAAEPLCKKCGKPLEEEAREYCLDCERRMPPFVQGCAAFVYRGMEDGIDRWKNQNRRCYTSFFASEMMRLCAGKMTRWKPEVIVPVPVHPRKRRMRGYNQAELLGEELAGRLGIEQDASVLRRVKNTAAQKELGDQERKKNIQGAFAADSQAGIYHTVLLVDDIYTTGSTASEACRALLDAGVQEVYFAAVCIGRGY